MSRLSRRATRTRPGQLQFRSWIEFWAIYFGAAEGRPLAYPMTLEVDPQRTPYLPCPLVLRPLVSLCRAVWCFYFFLLLFVLFDFCSFFLEREREPRLLFVTPRGCFYFSQINFIIII